MHDVLPPILAVIHAKASLSLIDTDKTHLVPIGLSMEMLSTFKLKAYMFFKFHALATTKIQVRYSYFKGELYLT